MSKHTEGIWEYRPSPYRAEVHAGEMFVCELRGWGYLTGRGPAPHALGLSPEEAVEIQDANGNLISAAPALLAALKEVVAISDRKHDAWDKAHAAIRKAEGK